MRLVYIAAALAITVSSCGRDINSPTASRNTITYQSVRSAMTFNADEQSLFDELTAGMPDDKAERIRARFVEPGVIVVGTNDREQQLVDGIYASMR